MLVYLCVYVTTYMYVCMYVRYVPLTFLPSTSYMYIRTCTQAPCGAKKLMAFVGRDASAAYDAAKHTDFAVEIAKHFYVGEFRDVSTYM